MTDWSSSRSRKAWKTGVIPPSSSGYEPRNIRWFSTRFSSASSVRSHTARSGTSMPSIRSTASTTPSSLENADSQSCRLASMMIWR